MKAYLYKSLYLGRNVFSPVPPNPEDSATYEVIDSAVIVADLKGRIEVAETVAETVAQPEGGAAS